ncbi:MAG: response regulator [Chloroflexota bacterium]
MIKVLIVDDSPTARTLLKHILQGSEGIQIAAVAASGADAISLTQQYRPDVILMDAIMPDMDGLEATRQIMEHQPTPIVIISSAASDSEANLAFHAIRAGALTVLGKPNGPGHPDFDVQARKIQRTLRSMASVAVIHHRRTAPRTPDSRVRPAHADEFRPEIVGIVASTGGPGILSRMLEELPPDYPLPIVIVQHIS